jgi:predicted ATP-grasp superfamily ATP-dependent carboligase
MPKKIDFFGTATSITGLATLTETTRAFTDPAGAAAGISAIFPVAIFTAVSSKFMKKLK